MVVPTSQLRTVERGSPGPRLHLTPEHLLDAADISVGVLFDRLLDAVVIARLATGRIVLWNPAAEKLFGYTAQEVIGKPIEILMPAPMAHVHRAGLEKYLRTGHGLLMDAGGPVDLPARTKSGEEIRVELALSEVRNAVGERFAVAVLRDAMHRKHLEMANLELAQARAARAEAEAALGARDELIGAVAAALETPPDADELARLAANLADVAHIGRGELHPDHQDADLVDLVHAASDAARRRACGRRLLVYTPPTAPASCDPTLLRHALDRLLDEVMCRTPEDARIELHVELVSWQLVRLMVRADDYTHAPAGIGLLLSRLLVQHQGATFTTEISPRGSLEVAMTLPGSPHPLRKRPRRVRRLGGRTATVL
jgi:PAS domain S-box-containing protein